MPKCQTRSKASKQSKKTPNVDTTMAQAKKIVSEMEKVFSAAAKTKDAARMAKYMRNQFEFFGIWTPERKVLTNQVLEGITLSPDLVLTTSQLLWQKPQREFQFCGLDLLSTHKKKLSGDQHTLSQAVLVVESLIKQKSWWDTVDGLASTVVGHLVKADRQKYGPLMDEWIESDNMWIRRTAIIHQLHYKADTDTDQLFRYCLQCSAEEEFFIRKAIGWALRQQFRHTPELVKDFVEKHKDKLSNLSIREALKHAK